MDYTNLSELAGAAVVIPIVIALLKMIVPKLRNQITVLVVLILSCAWGVVLAYAGQVPWRGADLPGFIIQILVTAASASGARELATTMVPGLSKLSIGAAPAAATSAVAMTSTAILSMTGTGGPPASGSGPTVSIVPPAPGDSTAASHPAAPTTGAGV